MSVNFDWARSREYGEARDAEIMELLRRFRFAQAEDVAALLLDGRVRLARARLLRLHQRGLLQRFATERNGAYIYTPGKRSQKAFHALVVLRHYRALLKALPAGWKVRAFDVEYEVTAGNDRRVISDALAILDNELAGRRRAVLLEVNLDDKFDQVGGYLALYRAGAYRKTWWYREDVQVTIAIATIHPSGVRRRIQAEDRYGLSWAVAHVRDAEALWREVLRAGTGSLSGESLPHGRGQGEVGTGSARPAPPNDGPGAERVPVRAEGPGPVGRLRQASARGTEAPAADREGRAVPRQGAR